MSVSLCMIVRNEEEMLPRCLNSVKNVVDDMVIVDTGSTDATKIIALSYGAKVYDYKWNDSFADARNFALSKATGDWIMIMDADDMLLSEDVPALTEIINSDRTVGIYYMKTLCFTGNTLDFNSAMMNINVRLIRNHMGYHYVGRIHEHPAGSAELPTVTENIRFYHYGYLKAVVDEKKKRRRNISLIEKELKERPDDPLMVFYLGNEYFSAQDYEKALTYFQRSYALCEHSNTLVTKSLYRMVICLENKKQTKDAFDLIDEGLALFPEFTDLEFLRAGLLLSQGKTENAIHSLNKCIKKGDPPPILCNLHGTGSFRPQFLLSKIYDTMGLVDKALYHCRRALISCPENTAILEMLYSLLHKKGLDTQQIAQNLERRVKPCSAKNCLLLSDIFYNGKDYEIAYDYAKKAEKMENADFVNPQATYDMGVCLFYQKKYGQARKELSLICAGSYVQKAAFFIALCDLFAAEGPQKGKYGTMGKEYQRTVARFKSLLLDKNCKLLAATKDASAAYIAPIFQLLETLLKIGRFTEFEKAVRLLNLIDDDTVLLRLAKTYYRNGYYKLALKEFMRSISLTGHIDIEALDMMKASMESYPA